MPLQYVLPFSHTRLNDRLEFCFCHDLDIEKHLLDLALRVGRRLDHRLRRWLCIAQGTFGVALYGGNRRAFCSLCKSCAANARSISGKDRGFKVYVVDYATMGLYEWNFADRVACSCELCGPDQWTRLQIEAFSQGGVAVVDLEFHYSSRHGIWQMDSSI